MAIKLNIQKDGKKTYWVYVHSRVHGKRLQFWKKGVETKKEAEGFEFEFRRQIANMKDGTPSYVWDEWFDKCVEKMKVEFRYSTLLSYFGKNTHWILPFWSGKNIKSITPSDVHEVVYNPEKNVSWYTRKTTLKIIKRILNMAVEEGILNRNPAVQVKVKVPQAKQAILNRTEVDRLLREAQNINHRFYNIWAMALLTGMRSGELFALKWSDVDLETGKIHITRSWSPKNGFGDTKTARHRLVPISPELRSFLLKLRQERIGGEFVLPRLQEWKTGNQAEVIKDFCIGIGITPIKFHDLRATFITQMLNNGVSLAIVMAIVGHGQIKTTQAYLRLAGLELKGGTDNLGITLPREDEKKIVLLNRSA